MYQYESVIKGTIAVSKVWDLYSNVNRWKEWDTYIEKVELEGAFVNGAKGTLYMQGMPPVPFTLAEIAENKNFTVISQLGNITTLLRYEILTEKKSNVVTLKDTVIIKGASQEELITVSKGIVPFIPEILERVATLCKMN